MLTPLFITHFSNKAKALSSVLGAPSRTLFFALPHLLLHPSSSSSLPLSLFIFSPNLSQHLYPSVSHNISEKLFVISQGKESVRFGFPWALLSSFVK